MITVSSQVVKLFLSLVQPPQGAQIYSNNLDSWKDSLDIPGSTGALVAGLTTSPATQMELETKYPHTVNAIRTSTPTFYQPKDTYHYGFAAFDFDAKQQPIPVQDKLFHWKASEYYENRKAPAHLIGLEGLLYATLTGGYFATVLPRNWLGKVMQFRRWWENNCATVARIALPDGHVRYVAEDDGLPVIRFGLPDKMWTGEDEIEHESLAQKWSLVIFQRPAVFGEKNQRTAALKAQLKKSEFRYTPFIFPMEKGIGKTEIEQCMKAFQASDWWKNSIRPWLHFIDENKNSGIVGTHRHRPISITEQEDYYFFDPSPRFMHQIKVVPKREDMKHKLAVQIKLGNTIRLTPNTVHGIGALLDMKSQEGMQLKQTGEMQFVLDSKLYRRPFSEIRDDLTADLANYGLIPYMVEADHHKMKKFERWLSIQLTPTERMVQIDAKAEHEQSLDAKDWEVMHEDIGMQATFPEIVAMWYKRAYFMNLDKYLKKFQLRDVVYTAIYQSHLNGNVMGLGKTRETLFAAILRCSKEMLIVCPSKLIDTWQDEIQNTLVPYARMQKVNWQGQPINVGCNIISDIASSSPSRREMFNLISIDTLKITPRDGEFYKCPVCGFVVFSKHKNAIITCPGNPAERDEMKRCNNVIKLWKDEVRHTGEQEGYWKFTELLNLDGSVMKRIGGHRIPKDFPVERVRFQDTRKSGPPRPEVPVMVPQGTLHKKMKRYQVGVKKNEITGKEEPVYKYKEREYHVKWTMSEILRGQFNMVAVDEAHNIANEDSARNQACVHLTAKTRLALTGTPLKSYPRKIIPILNWVFKRAVYPDYRPYDPGGLKRFDDRYELVVFMGGVQMADGSHMGGQRKVLPKINNSELFQSEMASLMIRRTRNEPEVASEIKPQKLIRERLEIDMDPQHKEYYQKWLDMFAEWWAEMKREREGKNVNGDNILVKLTYLANASFIPHYMQDNIREAAAKELKKKGAYSKETIDGLAWAQKIGKYEGPITAKMSKALKLLIENVKAGDKTLLFSYRKKTLQLGQAICEKKLKFNTMIIDGDVPIKPLKGETRGQRHRMVEDFRDKPYHAMWASTTAMDTGFNIPEANRGIILDYFWDDTHIRQAVGRMLRIQQQKTVYATNLLHKGAIDSYMAALSYLKSRGGDEAIDYMVFDDFSTKLIPDIRQYADMIVDGTQEQAARDMWTAIDFMNKEDDEEGNFDAIE